MPTTKDFIVQQTDLSLFFSQRYIALRIGGDVWPNVWINGPEIETKSIQICQFVLHVFYSHGSSSIVFTLLLSVCDFITCYSKETEKSAIFKVDYSLTNYDSIFCLISHYYPIQSYLIFLLLV